MAAELQSIADTFREFARRYSRAARAYANARATDLHSDRAELALSMKQALETEFQRCFVRVKHPDWIRVDDDASGILEDAR